MFHRFRQVMVRPERERLHGLVKVEEIYLAITDRQLRAADRGASATSRIQFAHQGVLANQWALKNPISGAQAAAGRRVKNTKPTIVVGCLVGYERTLI